MDWPFTSNMTIEMKNSLSRTRIKICGMSEPQAVVSAIELGVDAIGMILHADSPRAISIDQAIQIRAVVPAFVTLVGVFVNAPSNMLADAYNKVGLDLLQLHGDEDLEFAESLALPYVKAIRARSADQVGRDILTFDHARAVLLDPYVKGQHGGTGQALDLNLWPTDITTRPKLILAGGLSPDNLSQRLAAVSPFAVDLNSGIELSPGKKSISLMTDAVRAVRIHDAQSMI